MKIAPKLKTFLEIGALPTNTNGRWTKESGELWVAADRELRALLAVARAAKRAIPVVNNGAAGLAEAGYGATSIDVRAESDRLDRALARLERVSRKP